MSNSSKAKNGLLAKLYPIGLVILLAVLYGRHILRGEWQGVVFTLAVFAVVILYYWWLLRRLDRHLEQIVSEDDDDAGAGLR